MSATLDLSPMKRRLQRDARKRARLWARSLTALGGALTLVSAIGSASLGQASQPILDDVDDTLARIDTLTIESSTLLKEVMHADSSLRLIQEIGAQPDWSHLLALLGAQGGQNLTLDRVDLRLAAPVEAAAGPPTPRTAGNGPFTLSIDGRAVTQADATSYVLALESSGVFGRVALVESRRTGDGLIAFRIECSLGVSVSDTGGQS